ncbi:type VI secretion system baseplate subunit TssE [Polynucleobacter sp. IMCC30063]|uniref:type VI secretion system baseplate subunit TssE n=1 Tax=Polynucleobacter sp. IMCC30063 TaxID=2907298 RepID=UPI001F1C7274|nr:type VI secretion system baseplate subunit TssE [Polynucleobacter sp. IMCC30063]MCE7505986.1 type VI secretion system baseplate subunit TssE [Polynucleobacter sp. IMCC30063]
MRTRLLERIANLEVSNPTGVVVPHEVAIKRSIISYLERLLNTRRGDPAIDPYYGLPDMANIAGTLHLESNEQLEQDIVEQIQIYEKRYIEPSITQVIDEKNTTAFRYELRGMIDISEIGDVKREFIVDLKLNSGGRITLEENRGF